MSSKSVAVKEPGFSAEPNKFDSDESTDDTPEPREFVGFDDTGDVNEPY